MYALVLIHIPTVAEYMIKEGIDALNDVNGVKGSNMAEVAAKYNIPMIGINRGNLGFLTDIDPKKCLCTA